MKIRRLVALLDKDAVDSTHREAVRNNLVSAVAHIAQIVPGGGIFASAFVASESRSVSRTLAASASAGVHGTAAVMAVISPETAAGLWGGVAVGHAAGAVKDLGDAAVHQVIDWMKLGRERDEY